MSGPALPHRPRSAFVSFIAVLGILSGGSGVLVFALFAVMHPSLQNLVGLVSCIAALATAIGLWRRREWARQGFIWVLAYSTVMGFVGVLRSPRAAEIFEASRVHADLSQAELNFMTNSMRIVALVMSSIVALINLLIILKLRSRKVRREFDDESAAW